MKKLLLFCCFCLLLVGCEASFQIGDSDNPTTQTVEGVVLQADSSSVLISQKGNFSECDFLESYNHYMESDQNYELLSISNVSAQVGDVVSVEIKSEIAESYPGQAVGINLDVIAHLEQSATCAGTVPPEETVVYSQELLDVFPKTLQLQQHYSGYAEYGHRQTLVDIQNEGPKFFVKFEGEMMDGLGGQEPRLFDLTYEITDAAVIERIENHDEYNKLNDKNLLNSIIPQKTILKLPLEVGTSWQESFEYDGAEYIAKTSIVRAQENEAGNMEYETTTIVENITGYFENNYKESRTFECGKGLTAFSNLLSKQQVGVEYDPDEETEDLYLFGYSISTETVLEQ